MSILNKYSKVELALLIIAFICMIGIYFVTFFYGAFPKPEKEKSVKYKINMSITP